MLGQPRDVRVVVRAGRLQVIERKAPRGAFIFCGRLLARGRRDERDLARAPHCPH
jgi:hypothetical protein